MTLDRSIALFGTDEPSILGKRYEFGKLNFTLEAGSIRHLRFAGHEVLRGIQYLVRDRLWSTPAAVLQPPVEESGEGFHSIRYQGRITSASLAFSFDAAVRVSAEGLLTFKIDGESESEFEANRIGFTLLHPVPECVGVELTVEHLDGTVESSRFPSEISPSQPVFGIRALRYRVGEAVDVECRMTSIRPSGRPEPFEMEDQRNWSDASYKTYVGTLLEPLPYRVRAGERFQQEIELRCQDLKPETSERQRRTARTSLALGPRSETFMPSIGLAVPHGSAALSAERQRDLALLGPHHLSAYLQADDQDPEQTTAALRDLGEALGASIELEIELPCEDDPESELAAIASACTRTGLQVSSVLACPSAYLLSYQPNGDWPDVPPLRRIYAASREAFARARIGGGMLTYFTELNRMWPPRDAIDFVSHTITPIVHAADDQTLIENLTTLKFMSQTVLTTLGDIEHRLGPSAISMRHNPYGGSTIPNIENTRTAMADADPRECGLFAAAWTVGLVAQAAACALSAMTLFATDGPRSVLYRHRDRPQPWYDDTTDACVRPIYHVIKTLTDHARGHFREVRLTAASNPTLTAFAIDTDEQSTIWLANLSVEPTTITLEKEHEVGVLDVSQFAVACTQPEWSFSEVEKSLRTVDLDAYAVARCRIPM